MTKGTGLTQKKHDKICSLIKRLNSVSVMPQISCNYIVEGKQVHSKVYVWCKGRKAIEAFNGSANYTMNAFFVRRECMDVCNPKEANHYFNSLLTDTINCFDNDDISSFGENIKLINELIMFIIIFKLILVKIL